MILTAQELLLLLLGLLLLPTGAQPTTTYQLYVKPTESTPCPDPCHTLDEYAQNASKYFLSDTKFNFLPGSHSLGLPLNVSDVSNLALVVINTSTVSITCQGKFPIVFTDVVNLTLEELTFYACPAIVLSNLLDLSLLGCHMIASPQQDRWELNATNVLGKSSITGLTVAPQPNASLHHSLTILYMDTPTSQLARNHLKVEKCTFFMIALRLFQSAYVVDLILEDLEVLPVNHSGIVTSIQSPAPNNITMINFNLFLSLLYMGASSNSTTVVYVSKCDAIVSTFIFWMNASTITMEDSFFRYSNGFLMSDTPSAGPSVLLRNVTFSNSSGFPYADFGRYTVYQAAIILWRISNVHFTESKFLGDSGITTTDETIGTAMTLFSAANITFTNCEFRNNVGTAITVLNSSIVLSGVNVFSENIAYQGGGMAFYGPSYVTLTNNSDTQFVNNSVETVGGAIYVDITWELRCFLEVQDYNFCEATTAPLPRVYVTFSGNIAANGGHWIYGALLDACWVNKYGCGLENFSSVIHVNHGKSHDSIFSAITSKPTRSCVCVNGTPSCTAVFNNLSVFPGETFRVPAVVVGDLFGTVDGSVHAHLLLRNSGSVVAHLDDLQYTQRVTHQKCTQVLYTILSNSSTVLLVLTAESELLKHYPNSQTIYNIKKEIAQYNKSGEIGPLLQLTPVFIYITLRPCPLGFVLSGEPPRCNCETKLTDNRVHCNLSSQTVQRSGTEWVNASFKSNNYIGVIVNKYCPNGYCKSEMVNVNLEHPDTQCAFNHSGILCGGCQPGLSLALGSIQCLSCSNDYLALVIPFGLAGIALVFFIKLLNLTVAVGSLNGLILYANIIRANQALWIPDNDTNILTVFIAWLNLDLGIEVCFFDGLNAYWKTWLEFAFPMYIWAIVIVITILAHYSSVAAKAFGANSVQLLATLFLLSYSKLLRAVVSILQMSFIDYPDGTSATVWSYDGNIPYLSPPHAPLFAVALAVTLFLWLPYTGVLTLVPWFQKTPNYQISMILLKVKPFLDAYFGPFKDNRRYWAGLLLLVRGFLFVIFAATPATYSQISLLVTLATVLGLLMYLSHVGRVYRKYYLSLLENSFLVNLGLFSGGTLYIQSNRGSQTALAYMSVGIALAQFAAVVAVHAVLSLKKYCKACPKVGEEDRTAYEKIIEDVVVSIEGKMEEETSLASFREPVLNYVGAES